MPLRMIQAATQDDVAVVTRCVQPLMPELRLVLAKLQERWQGAPPRTRAAEVRPPVSQGCVLVVVHVLVSAALKRAARRRVGTLFCERPDESHPL
jgi:hypothetical protein